MIILVIEDEYLIAMDLEEALRQAGHEVLGPAPNVPRALELAEQRRPDLALSDIELGKSPVSGIDAARELLSRHGVPSLFLSGSADKARRNQDAALGIIHKPYAAPDLLRSIEVARALIEGQQPPPAPASLELFGDGTAKLRSRSSKR